MRQTTTALVLATAFTLALAPMSSGRAVKTKSTPLATLTSCDRQSQSLRLVTLQTSTSRSDRLRQRYFGQYYDRPNGKWVTFSKTGWRAIANRSRTVKSSTVFELAEVQGQTVRYRVKFRWITKAKRGKRGRRAAATRVTKKTGAPLRGKSRCRF